MTADAFEAVKKLGIHFARRGGAPEYEYREGRGFAYEPGFDHPLLIPSAGDARPDWTLDNFIAAAEQARHGRIAVLQFHGIPDTAHAWVSTSAQNFDAYMNYLAKNGYTVVAMRDLAKYVDADAVPSNHQTIIDDRRQSIERRASRDNFRRPQSDEELRFWLENMLLDHGFTDFEVSAATGLSLDEVAEVVARFSLRRRGDTQRAGASARLSSPQASPPAVLKVRPYPGGRHPRIGFLDGAIRPQRETKFSAFLPWDSTQYVVADIPEAIWMREGEGRALYLAHTHVPTIWSRSGTALEPLEWIRDKDGSLRIERRLPNDVTFGAAVSPTRDAVRMELWLTNGTQETLRGLAVQNCVMLKGAGEFNSLTSDNKLFRDPYVACRNAAGNRWIITAWENCMRPWGNAPCPCMHSDPQFPDCAPVKPNGSTAGSRSTKEPTSTWNYNESMRCLGGTEDSHKEHKKTQKGKQSQAIDSRIDMYCHYLFCGFSCFLWPLSHCQLPVGGIVRRFIVSRRRCSASATPVTAIQLDKHRSVWQSHVGFED